MRSISRSYFTMILVFITIFMTFVSFHLYKKDQNRQEFSEIIRPVVTKGFQTGSKKLVTEPIFDEGIHFFVQFNLEILWISVYK
jgi:hypothetical protein